MTCILLLIHTHMDTWMVGQAVKILNLLLHHTTTSSSSTSSQAVKILKAMEAADLVPDESTYNAVIGAFANGGEWRDALKYTHTHTHTNTHTHTHTHGESRETCVWV